MTRNPKKLPWVPKSWRRGANDPTGHQVGIVVLFLIACLAYGTLLAPNLPDWVTLAVLAVLVTGMVWSTWVAWRYLTNK